MAEETLLDVRDLQMYFHHSTGLPFRRRHVTVRAVDQVSFRVRRGETLGLVGESGCGKSTIGRTILQLYKPTAGEVIFEGRDLCTLTPSALRPLRRKLQMIFQDPYSSLNPRLRIGDAIEEPIALHGLLPSRRARRERVGELLRLVGLSEAYAERFPHEFSGGQRQRIGIARALAVEPQLIICDEPVSALDVSIQAQIVNLLKDLQVQLGLTYIFIAHDLAVVRHISDRVAVMYLGNLVELAPSADLYRRPLHPYTRALLSAVPVPDPDVEAGRQRVVLTGEVPSPANPPSGCRFHPRCPFARGRCRVERPIWRPVATNHFVACHLAEEISDQLSINNRHAVASGRADDHANLGPPAPSHSGEHLA
jgi:oligopeptide transport system ATP-binding protein